MATLTTNAVFAGKNYIKWDLAHTSIPFTTLLNITAPAAAVGNYPHTIPSLTGEYEIGLLASNTTYTYSLTVSFMDGTTQNIVGATITTRPDTLHVPVKTKNIPVDTSEISVKSKYPDFFDNTVGRTLTVKPIGGNILIRFGLDQSQITVVRGVEKDFYPAQEVYLQAGASITADLTLSSKLDKAN